MGITKSKPTPLHCMLTNFKQFSQLVDVPLTPSKLKTACQNSWITLGTGWSKSGSFDPTLVELVYQKVISKQAWSTYPYIQAWLMAVQTKPAWLQAYKKKMLSPSLQATFHPTSTLAVPSRPPGPLVLPSVENPCGSNLNSLAAPPRPPAPSGLPAQPASSMPPPVLAPPAYHYSPPIQRSHYVVEASAPPLPETPMDDEKGATPSKAEPLYPLREVLDPLSPEGEMIVKTQFESGGQSITDDSLLPAYSTPQTQLPKQTKDTSGVIDSQIFCYTKPLLTKVGDVHLQHEIVVFPTCPKAMLGRDSFTKIQADSTFTGNQIDIRIPEQHSSIHQIALLLEDSSIQSTGIAPNFPGVNSVIWVKNGVPWAKDDGIEHIEFASSANIDKKQHLLSAAVRQDLKNAFSSIHLALESRPYFAFAWEDLDILHEVNAMSKLEQVLVSLPALANLEVRKLLQLYFTEHLSVASMMLNQKWGDTPRTKFDSVTVAAIVLLFEKAIGLIFAFPINIYMLHEIPQLLDSEGQCFLFSQLQSKNEVKLMNTERETKSYLCTNSLIQIQMQMCYGIGLFNSEMY